VIDHLEKGSLDLSNLQYLVLDEADEMLRMGFAEDVEKILEGTPDSKQVEPCPTRSARSLSST